MHRHMCVLLVLWLVMRLVWSLFTLWVREVAQSCPTLCDPMDCSLPGPSVHGIFQAIVLEWIAININTPSLVAQTVNHLPTMRENQVRSLGREDPLEKEMTTHSSTLAWKIPSTEDPGGLQSMGLQRVRHDWATSLSLFFTFCIGLTFKTNLKSDYFPPPPLLPF